MERQLQSRLGFHKRRGLSCSPAPAVGSGLVVMPPRVPQSWLFRSRLEHRSCRQGHGRSGHRGAADGPRVREVKFPDVAQIIADWFPLCSVQTAVAHEATYPARKSEYGPALSSFIDLGSALSGLDYQKIILRRASFQGHVAALFQGIDLLLVPAQSLASPTTTQMAHLGEDTEMLNALVRYTMPFDMTGSPTITLPCGFTDIGTPLAFQFVGRHLEEEMLVRAGYAYQTATDWHRKHPALPSD